MTLSFEDILFPELDRLKNKRVLVAFSGGKDSLALLDFLNCHNKNFFLCACHVNHGLREEADIDEEFCRNFCKSNSIPFKSVLISKYLKSDMPSGIEDSARRYRYIALNNAANEWNCDYILTAHTFNDQIESFFVDLYTGTSIFTLGGIWEESDRILRLMLKISTELVEDYLKRRSLTPIFDKSNNNTSYIRNNVRRNVLPYLLNAGTQFIPSVLRLQSASRKLGRYFENNTSQSIILNSDNIVEIDKTKFLQYDDLEREYLIGKIFSQKFRFTGKLIDETLKLLNRAGSKRINLPSDYLLEISYSKIILFKKNLINPFYFKKEIGIDNIINSDFEIYFKGLLVNAPLIIRSRKKGDKLQNGGKLKDAFIDNKIDLFLRDRAVTVWMDDKLIWSEHLKINNAFYDLISIKRFL